jgi:hypothetical protein
MTCLRVCSTAESFSWQREYVRLSAAPCALGRLYATKLLTQMHTRITEILQHYLKDFNASDICQSRAQ